MNLNIEIPEELALVLTAKAEAKGVPAPAYARLLLEQLLLEGSPHPRKPRKSAYGLLAQYGPGPTSEDIDENRKEMFRGFAEKTP